MNWECRSHRRGKKGIKREGRKGGEQRKLHRAIKTIKKNKIVLKIYEKNIALNNKKRTSLNCQCYQKSGKG